MHMTATLTKWYEEHGRHEIFAGGKKVKMDDEAHNLLLRDDLVTTELQHDLDNLGIAKNSREEKKRARDAKQLSAISHQPSAEPNDEIAAAGQHRGPVKNDEAYNARMAAMYREVVLKEKPAVAENGFIPLGALGKANGGIAPAPKPEVAEPVAGD
jgi:hypothetical protein